MRFWKVSHFIRDTDSEDQGEGEEMRSSQCAPWVKGHFGEVAAITRS